MATLVAHSQDTPRDPASLSPEQDALPAKISAYYSLVFPSFTYYLQTLNVTIGRRCIPLNTASSSDNPQVDVDLGALKSVSRLHAKIEYEEEEERFVLIVIGRNGAWVDGVWSGSGSKVPLNDRSQIQIASRTFHFILPPPPAPEDSPSPSSHSSDNRARSRSPSLDIVDVTSISPPSSIPPCSPPPPAPVSSPLPAKIPPLSEASLPNSNNISKFKTNAKKRKKSDALPPPPPPPEIMPPKPPFTYAQLCYRAIKALGGKASLQEICQWVRETFDWYKYCAKDWESSVRHNLSSNPGFKKVLRGKEEKGKGALWLVDEAFEHSFEEQDARRQAAAAAASTGGKDGKPSGKKGKNTASLEPLFKRSVKGDVKGPLPPPLTSAPLVFKTNSTSTPHVYPPTAASLHASSSASVVKLEPSPAPEVKFEPTQILEMSTAPTMVSQVSPPSAPVRAPTSSALPTANPPSSSSVTPSSAPAIPATVCIPIIVGHVPQSSTSTGPAAPPKPIVLHDNSLILNPEIFSHLTPEHLKDLEALGAQKALEILQSYIVRYYKEKLKAEGGRARGRGKPKKAKGAATGAGLSWTYIANAGPDRSAQASPSAPGPPTPAPESAPSPIVVIDDDDDTDEGPAAKRRRLDAPPLPP
ncbi:uncharacterized protein B0H18DRAFT_1112627 [Fomitopsis serialis]|uniref:uncharacterized protein n=1 Tax=Fomitopsis serialis TaxID=139415 RepID=UPI0020080205|nr:uncharacterized protein B0H18DRAFT_1112627 [Neoantrodia serialis]KAH9938473.1 hypothetical protein B0H18DRAFT_1112627 [Neoantrodia serialis]